ncbi:acyl-CoA dehydrogenase family protein [Microbacterium sp. LWH3-1.2]|uniref:acyl-CoA dehydrogenase family protein n=1 Tax=Microbacterium sp. LWH3-1.2 TaxID=3135256 RepID=UPI00342FC67E
MGEAEIRSQVSTIISKIDALRPLLVASGRSGDQTRHVDDEAFAALVGTGAFAVSAPEKFGGLAANTRESIAVARAVARGDGSLAWMFGILDSGAWVLSLMDDRAQADVWGNDADGNRLVSIVLATTSDSTPTDGGYRVSGKWAYGTGSTHANWSLLGIPLRNGAGEIVDAGLALIPASDLSSEDNWHVAGMRSTSSVTQIAQDVFVPAHRVLPLTAAVEGDHLGSNTETTYRTVFVPSLFMKLVGPHLGMGRAALDFLISHADTKSIPYTGYEKQADSSIFQSVIARASVNLSAAESVAQQVADEIYAGADRDYYAPYATRIEMRAKAAWVVETITAVINDLVTAHGSSGFAEASSLQRIWRDQATAATHGHTLGASGYEAYGKVLLGREDDARFVLPIV